MPVRRPIKWKYFMFDIALVKSTACCANGFPEFLPFVNKYETLINFALLNENVLHYSYPERFSNKYLRTRTLTSTRPVKCKKLRRGLPLYLRKYHVTDVNTFGGRLSTHWNKNSLLALSKCTILEDWTRLQKYYHFILDLVARFYRSSKSGCKM